MKQTMTLHCSDSFSPSNIYDNNNTEKKKQDRSETGVFLVILSAKTIDMVFFKRVVLSSYKSYNHFVVFNNKFKDGSTLTKRWIWSCYPIDSITKHMQIFNMLKALTFWFFLPSLPQAENHRKKVSFRNQDILLEPKKRDLLPRFVKLILVFDLGSLCNLGHVSKLNC